MVWIGLGLGVLSFAAARLIAFGTLFRLAVDLRSVRLMRLLLRLRLDPFRPDPNGYAPWLHVLLCGSPAMVEAVFCENACRPLVLGGGSTLLLPAAAFGSEEAVVRLLLDHGADPTGPRTALPIFRAIGRRLGCRLFGDAEAADEGLRIARLLLERGADIASYPEVAALAARAGDDELVALFREFGG
ncbi:MAG: hypothetical protein HYU66_14910 [Armatimonadetes bacterium]|nr:hypothetical protein [Armatimonadota bacterium]